MPVDFHRITKGKKYSRPDLASIWGYKGYQALARGVVTPVRTDKIILFVTEEKQDFLEQYKDKLVGSILEWEGPTDHFAEPRMLNASSSGDEIHVFHRDRHHSDFTYLGQAFLLSCNQKSTTPSEFKFEIR
jgi:hypothetical protein